MYLTTATNRPCLGRVEVCMLVCLGQDKFDCVVIAAFLNVQILRGCANHMTRPRRWWTGKASPGSTSAVWWNSWILSMRWWLFFLAIVDDEDGDSFYNALFSAFEQTLCTFVRCDSKWVTVAFLACFEYPPKCQWCTYIAVQLLHGWCHMKLLLS